MRAFASLQAYLKENTKSRTEEFSWLTFEARVAAFGRCTATFHMS
jgi:hypothetical protein